MDFVNDVGGGSGLGGAPELTNEEIECPHAKVGTVIGAKGIIIQEVMRRTRTKIVVIQDGVPDGAPRKILIDRKSVV